MNNNWKSLLGDLTDPRKYQNNINLGDVDKNTLLSFYSKMVLIREAEMMIAKLIIDGKVKCPCHLAVGQEAIATGISEHLNDNDYVFGNHRSHGHYLSMGADLDKLIAEVLGKLTGCSSGMGGSMHLVAEDKGFKGSVPIVAGTIPIATGAALAAQKNNKGQIAVSYFGDGSTEEGGFHESMNIASVYNLPILFVCENNLYSSHLDIMLRQPSDSIARYAKAHNIKYEIVDGNDVVSVYNKAEELINNIRQKGEPAFIEAVTYRWMGHVGPDENIDVGVRRSKKELDSWKKRDPIARLENALLSSDIADSSALEEIKTDILRRIDTAVEKAVKASYPPENNLLDLVLNVEH